jgi:hypothetical protein
LSQQDGEGGVGTFAVSLWKCFTSDYRRSIMPWCLTNGLEYLFGIVLSGEVYHNCRLDTAIAFDNNANITNNLRTIMKVLTFWVSISHWNRELHFNYCLDLKAYAPEKEIGLSMM